MNVQQTRLIVKYSIEMVLYVAPLLFFMAKVTGITGLIIGFMLTIVIFAIWNFVGVLNDPDRSNLPIYKTSGKLRLIIELILLSLASIGLLLSSFGILGVVFIVITVFYYLLNFDRVKWLMQGSVVSSQ